MPCPVPDPVPGSLAGVDRQPGAVPVPCPVPFPLAAGVDRMPDPLPASTGAGDVDRMSWPATPNGSGVDRMPCRIGRPTGVGPPLGLRANVCGVDRAGVDRAGGPAWPHLPEIRRGAEPGPPKGNELSGGFIRRPIGQTFLV